MATSKKAPVVEETTEEIVARLYRDYPYLNEVDYRALTSIEEVKDFLSGLEPGQILSLDYETSGLNPDKHHIVGVALSYAERSAVYIPVAHTENPDLNVPIEVLAPVLNAVLAEHPVLVFNYKFEKNFSLASGIYLGAYLDCLPATYIMNPNIRSQELKIKSMEFLNIGQIKFSEVCSAASIKQGKTFADVPLAVAVLYAAGDADITLRLWHASAKARKDQPLIFKIENDLVEVIRCMELNGVQLDIPYFLYTKKELEDRRERVERRIFEQLGKFDINSPPQVGRKLFVELGIPPERTTDSGKPATDEKSIQRLESKYPIVADILFYRKLTKQISTYVDNFIAGVDENGIGKFAFKTCRADTGRIAASSGGDDSGYVNANVQSVTSPTPQACSGHVITGFTPEALAEFRSSYIKERLETHYSEWLSWREASLLKERWQREHFVAWKKENEVAGPLKLTEWREAQRQAWRLEAREEWKRDFAKSHAVKVAKEYDSSPDKQGCHRADIVGWGDERKGILHCGRTECVCLKNGKAQGFKLEPDGEDEALKLSYRQLPPIRRGFLPRAGYVWVAIDYSGVEVRIAANLSKEPVWEKEFTENPLPDPHEAAGRRIYGVEKCTKEQRSKAKTSGFTILFGGGGYTVAANIGGGMSSAEGDELVAEYFRGLPTLSAWIDATHDFASTYGYVKTYFGRIRPLPAAQSSVFKLRKKGHRDSVSSKVQGTAADIMKFSLVKLHAKIKEMGWEDDVHMLLTIHDECDFEIREDMVAEVVPVLVDTMTQHNISEWKVPLACDIDIGNTWGSTVEHKLYKRLLVKSDDYKALILGTKTEEEVFGRRIDEPNFEEFRADEPVVKVPDTITLHIDFVATVDTLKKFHEVVRGATGDSRLRLVFTGLESGTAVIDSDARVDRDALLAALREHELKVMVE